MDGPMEWPQCLLGPKIGRQYRLILNGTYDVLEKYVELILPNKKHAIFGVLNPSFILLTKLKSNAYLQRQGLPTVLYSYRQSNHPLLTSGRKSARK